LYDDDRTFDTMVIVLTNGQEGKSMNEHVKIEATDTAPAAEQSNGHRGPTPSQVAAAVEAAYILEAVRK
jgi:hypothetical protein